MKTTKRLLVLLLSLVITVTFMPLTAFAAEEPEIGDNTDNYELQAFVDGQASDVAIAPGDVVTLEAKLFHHFDDEDGNFVEEVIPSADVSFHLDVIENVVFDGREEEDEHTSMFFISSESDDNPDDENYPSADGKWTLESFAITPEDSDQLFSGNGIFHISATYAGMKFNPDWDRGIGVGCRIDYDNTKILTGSESFDNSLLETYLPDMSDTDTIDINPTCNTNRVTDFEFEIGGYRNFVDEEGNDQWEFEPYKGKIGTDYGRITGSGTDKVLKLTKADIKNIIKNTDPSFLVRVSAKGIANIDFEDKTATYASNCIDVLVDDGLGDLFTEYRIECPSSIEYVEGQTVYDVVDEFKLISNETGLEQKEDDDIFEWRFVQVSPDLLPPGTPQEDLDAANILHGGKLTLDHLGKYWVVAAGIGEYRSFLIKSFELTDADVFYTKKPIAKEGQTYTGETNIELVTTGDANIGTVQYKVDNGLYLPTLERVNAAKDYNVSYRVVDAGGNVIIPEETVRVRVDRAPINIVLNDTTKVYGTPDPDYISLINKEKSSENIDDFLSDIRFGRESGEDVNGTGYRVFAHLESENYVPHIRNARLKVTKADYRLSVTDKVSFDVGDTYSLPYYSDGICAKIEPKTGEANVLHATVKNGSITLEASDAWSGSVDLVIAGDKNHNEARKTIEIEATEAIANSTDGSHASTTADNKQSLSGTTLAVITNGATESEGKIESNNVDITLSNDDGAITTYTNAGIIVKIKLEDELDEGSIENLIGSTELKAKCSTDSQPVDAWLELIGGCYYLCFETTHLSSWTFSGTAPTDIGDCNFNLPREIHPIVRFQDENITEYYDINLGTDILTIGEEASKTALDPECYILKFANVDNPDDEPENYDLERITETGLYKVKAEAVIGKGYVGENYFDGTINVEEVNHDFSEDWTYDEYTHWHECSDTNCKEVADQENHNYKDIVENKYLASEATCTELAKYYKSCKCGKVSTETFTAGEFKEHTLSPINRIDATADKDGCIEHWKCKGCGGCFNMDASHQYTNAELVTHYQLTYVEYKAATETVVGNLEYWYCPVCEKYFKNEAATELFMDNEWIIPATGGGGTVIPTEPTEPEIVVDPTSGGIIVDIGGEAKVEEDKASAVITTDTAKAIAEAATKSGTTEIKLDATVKESVDKAELEIPMVIAEAAKTNGASVEIATNIGIVVLDKQTVKGLAATDADSITVSVEKTKESGDDKAVFDITLTAVKDGKTTTISKLQGTAQVVAPLPSGVKAEEACGLYMNGKLAEKVTTKVDGKNVVLTVKHFSTYGIMSNDDADKLFKESAEATTMGKLTLKTYKGGRIKASWKNGKGNTGDITKYQVYYKQSGKKAKYTTTTSKSKTIKKLKKGKTYTVKARAYIKINGKTYKSKWTSAKKIKCK